MFSDVLQQRIMSEMGMSALYTLEEIVGYEPERSFNYELGFHSKPMDGLQVDGTFFLIDCRNQQLTIFPPGTTTGRIMTNAGRTRTRASSPRQRGCSTARMAHGARDSRRVRLYRS